MQDYRSLASFREEMNKERPEKTYSSSVQQEYKNCIGAKCLKKLQERDFAKLRLMYGLSQSASRLNDLYIVTKEKAVGELAQTQKAPEEWFETAAYENVVYRIYFDLELSRRYSQHVNAVSQHNKTARENLNGMADDFSNLNTQIQLNQIQQNQNQQLFQLQQIQNTQTLGH